MNVDQNQAPATYLKSKQGEGSSFGGKKNNLRIIAMILGLLVFIGGGISVFLISQKQDTAPIAPNVPQSKPAAYIEKTQTCTLEFDVTEPDKVACGQTGCTVDADCSTGLVCVGETEKYCAKAEFEDACLTATDDTRVEACCTAPETETIACGESGCTTTSDCDEGFVCISTSETNTEGDIVKYCADEDYLDACVASPSSDSCCSPEVTTTVTTTVTATATATLTTTATATATNTVTATSTVSPSVTTVITTVGCNDTCSANADCSNISHICYQGQCRLDVNPTDAQCKLPSGETTIVRPVKVPTQSGPADWMNYVKAGLGALGVGALLLLLL